MKPVLLGAIAHRASFPAAHAAEGGAALRTAVAGALGEAVEYVDLGAVGDYDDARRAAHAARRYRPDPDGRGAIGLVVSAWDFGDENAIRDLVRLADLDVPILLHTEPDVPGEGGMGSRSRRDAVCGRFAIANALRHIGAPYTLTTRHAENAGERLFAGDLRAFAATGRIATRFRRRGRGVRLGCVGSGPDAFQTVTSVSSELLGHLGLTTVGMELLELDRAMRACSAADTEAEAAAILAYLPAPGIPDAALAGIARLALVLRRFIAEHDLDGVAVRCWTEMQKHRIGGLAGISPCAAMSRLLDGMVPAACEVDIAGWMGMYLLQIASGLVPSLGDWNNQFPDRDDEVDLFHCGVWAKSVLKPGARITPHAILAGADPAIGEANCWGTVDGHLRPGACAFFRPCTNAREGGIFAYGGAGEVLPVDIGTFGTTGRIRIPGQQRLFARLTAFERAVEHHCPVIVGDPTAIADAMQGVRQAIPYLNHQAGRNAAGTALVAYDEHSRIIDGHPEEIACTR